MNKVFKIYHQNELLITYKKKKFYENLGDAKIAAKSYIKSKNLKLHKDERYHFDEFKIKEFELVERAEHPL